MTWSLELGEYRLCLFTFVAKIKVLTPDQISNERCTMYPSVICYVYSIAVYKLRVALQMSDGKLSIINRTAFINFILVYLKYLDR